MNKLINFGFHEHWTQKTMVVQSGFQLTAVTVKGPNQTLGTEYVFNWVVGETKTSRLSSSKEAFCYVFWLLTALQETFQSFADFNNKTKDLFMHSLEKLIYPFNGRLWHRLQPLHTIYSKEWNNIPGLILFPNWRWYYIMEQSPGCLAKPKENTQIFNPALTVIF